MTLEILGAGFGRTGTSSLKLALEHLGFGPCHHMHEVRDNPHLIVPWQDFVGGKPLDFEQAFEGYRSQVDWPGARVWRESAERYPRAKMILTIRDPDEWFDSVQGTIAPFLASRGTNDNAHADAIAAMAHKLIAEAIFDNRLSDRDHAIKVFNAHIAEVQAIIPASRLLTFDVREGWGPLCAFLGVPVPAISFPKLNSSRQFVDNWDSLNESAAGAR
jgi:hypothetical protein